MEKNKINQDNMRNVPSSDNKDNALEWIFEIDGCKKDIRKEPREFQEQAYYSGMIPFIPADYPKQSKGKEKFKNNIRIIEYRPRKSNSTASEQVPEQND